MSYVRLFSDFPDKFYSLFYCSVGDGISTVSVTISNTFYMYML